MPYHYYYYLICRYYYIIAGAMLITDMLRASAIITLAMPLSRRKALILLL